MGTEVNESKAFGPTVILLGGSMIVEDGSALDSRQPITDDPQCRIMRTCLAGSLRWWLTVISLVQPLLRAAGDDAFCLIIGGRTLLELEADGSVRRTGLRSVVPGGLSRVEIVRTGIEESLDQRYEPAGKMDLSWDGTSMGEIGLLYSEPRLPWRVLDGNEWYLKQAGPTLRPAVIIDTTDSVLLDQSFESLSTRRLFDERITLVLPHTLAAERHMRAYALATSPRRSAPPMTTPLPWDPEAPPDPMRYTKLVPIEASFGVTGLVQHRQWHDPSDLEAARALLEARFDLQIGIWDLVGNATLRGTLLNATPTEPAPREEVSVPSAAVQRARQDANARVDDRVNGTLARSKIDSLCTPLLQKSGWRSRHGAGDFSYEQFGEPLPRWSGELAPVVVLTLTIGKRQTSVIVHSVFASAPAHECLRAQADRFAEIALSGTCDILRDYRQVLWREPGGWADEVDWAVRVSELLARTQQWVGALKPYIDECRRFQQEELTKRQNTTATLSLEVHVDAQGAVNAIRTSTRTPPDGELD